MQPSTPMTVKPSVHEGVYAEVFNRISPQGTAVMLGTEEFQHLRRLSDLSLDYLREATEDMTEAEAEKALNDSHRAEHLVADADFIAEVNALPEFLVDEDLPTDTAVLFLTDADKACITWMLSLAKGELNCRMTMVDHCPEHIAQEIIFLYNQGLRQVETALETNTRPYAIASAPVH